MCIQIVYLNVFLGGEFISLVLEIERVEPLKEREVEAKMNVGSTLHGPCKCPCTVTIAMIQLSQTTLNSTGKLTVVNQEGNIYTDSYNPDIVYACTCTSSISRCSV